MCVEAYVAASDAWCNTVGELTDALGGEPILENGYAHPIERNMCLCGVDFEATAERFGKVVYWPDPEDNQLFGLKDRKPSKRELRAGGVGAGAGK
jgi:hypothetical protein